jgi:hypothetical protein
LPGKKERWYTLKNKNSKSASKIKQNIVCCLVYQLVSEAGVGGMLECGGIVCTGTIIIDAGTHMNPGIDPAGGLLGWWEGDVDPGGKHG